MSRKLCLVIRSAKVAILLLCIVANFLHQTKCEVYNVDGSKGLKRNAGHGLAYANFVTQKFYHLNITPLISHSAKVLAECGKMCVVHPSCFSANFAEYFHGIVCELLPSDKYNNSNKFLESAVFHHLSIKTPCSRDPCLNNATCVAKYEDNEYHCVCAPGFHGKNCEEKVLGVDCKGIKTRNESKGDGIYLLDPDGGNPSNAFPAYCDMTSYGGGWTMCYTTDEFAKPRTEVTYNPQLPYGRDGYRTNCNNIPFTEIIFIDHQTGNKTYFKRRTQGAITAAGNYGKAGGTYGLWDGVGAMNSAYSYQLLICDIPFYSGFLVSGYTSNYFKGCNDWCGDSQSPYFRTASNAFGGVAFGISGHVILESRLVSVGLR